MTILVTGGAGFIGSHLVDALVDRGHEIIVLDDLSHGRRENLADHLKGDQVRLVVDSILNQQLCDKLVAKSSLVYHLAAIVGLERVCPNPISTLEVNIAGTHNILDLCRRYGIKVLLASSSEAYGKNEKVPLHEDDDTILGWSKAPRWSYAISKLADEHYAWKMMKDLPIVIVRYFNSYGPRVQPTGGSGVIARFIKQALTGAPITVFGDGQQTRSYTYITDVVEATINAAEKARGEIFNIGNPIETSINELAGLIKKLTGSNSEIVHRSHPKYWGIYEETRRRVPDINRATEYLDFRPTVPLAEGLERTIAWMRPRLDTILDREVA